MSNYCLVSTFKERFYPPDSTDVEDDAVIASVISAVSKEIDNYCHRRFWKNLVAETRYLTAAFYDLMFTPDIVSVTGVATDEDGDRLYSTSLAATDYDLEPYNAALDGLPYTRMRLTPNSTHSFVTSQKGIKLTGIFGYPSVPDEVKEACMIQSIRLFKRKDAPFGVTGSAEMGQLMILPSLDPDVKLLLEPHVKDKVTW